MAYEPSPNIADQRRKQLVKKLMGQAGGGRVPMPAAAEGRSFHSVGRFGGLPRVATTHASSIAQAIAARLGAGMNPGLGSEVSPGLGAPIPHPAPPIDHGPPIAPPIPPALPPGVNPPPSTGAITPAPGSSGPVDMGPAGAPGASGGVNPIPAPAQSTLLTNAQSGANANFIPLGGGLYYDPSTDTVLGSGSSAGGGAARRL